MPPTQHISPPVLARGLRVLLYDAICSQSMATFAAAPFLVAIALSLGSSTLVIGLITALQPLTQMGQLPAMRLIERIQHRKLIVVVMSTTSRVFWLGIAAAPFFVAPTWRVPVFLASLIGLYAFSTISLLAFNMWMRDLIPEQIRGEYSGHRNAVATLVGAGLSVALGFAADYYGQHHNRIVLLSCYLVLATVIGWLGCWFLSRIPEPRMSRSPDASFTAALKQVFADRNYRALILFLCGWSFSLNIAMPFFAVFMLERLRMSLGWVMGLSVLALGGSVFFLRLWGRLADRFSNKAVLLVLGPTFLVSLAAWSLLPLLTWWWLLIAVLAVLHIIAGTALSGIGMVMGNAAMKLAPPERTGAYLSVVGAITGLSATVAPVMVGLLAKLVEPVAGMNPGKIFVGSLAGYDIGLIDLVFLAAAMLGWLSLRLMRGVTEMGDAPTAQVRALLLRLLRSGWRRSLGFQGFVALLHFPYGAVAAAKGGRFANTGD